MLNVLVTGGAGFIGSHIVDMALNEGARVVCLDNCSNNFGPRQHAEKLIPVVVRRALANAPIPVYGDGSNVRDWLFVEDHACGLLRALKSGRVGETYCFGGNNEISNLELVRMICAVLDEVCPRKGGGSHLESVALVRDRPGHDWRYAVDSAKARNNLEFECGADFPTRLDYAVRSLAGSYLSEMEHADVV
jgi:dTDP-glucose 4,6-dehydratase